MSSVTVAVCQMDSRDDKPAKVERACAFVEDATAATSLNAP